jgi:hypothetical protein
MTATTDRPSLAKKEREWLQEARYVDTAIRSKPEPYLSYLSRVSADLYTTVYTLVVNRPQTR